ncbi:peptidoglycan-binding protein [Oculatella sp. FACHB-28]|uniref:peptidoglycan-binding domain-containing protein n=1 Tax=Oculatella sp. FACHB-28 TaxID=2692845 RepID=UPI001689A150|nr:peptidoglycan-binding domain-containing protein [Oculatella sp. FACHB-28]MBD2054571.1 peptidoglycan-binding protein [Oculatella sp. FACHB-28]
MAQTPNNQDSAVEEAKRLKFLGYSFSAISFIVFAYILLFPAEKELKQQAIYWFASSFVAAIIPNVKQFKIKDVEVQLQEISQKIEDNKNLIEQRTEELKESLFLSLESVREREESLPEEYKSKREQKYQRYAERLKNLTTAERLKEQKRFTRSHLNNIDMDIADLKRMLQKAGLYQGLIDEVFDEQLALSISAFQEKYGVTPIDGTAGPKTLSKLSEIMK